LTMSVPGAGYSRLSNLLTMSVPGVYLVQVIPDFLIF
jgi:hypothetical protein